MLLRAVAAVCALQFGLALRPQTAPRVEDDDCPESEVKLDGKGGCVDDQDRNVPLHCCAENFDCKAEVSRFTMLCSVRIQTFMQVCQIPASAIDSSGSSLRLTSTSQLCTEECQTHEALWAINPLEKLDVLRGQCSKELGYTMAIIASLEGFNAAWSECRGEAVAAPTLDADAQSAREVHAGDSTLDSASKPEVAKKGKWGKVEITTRSEPPVDLVGLFEATWTAVPVTWSQEFQITGTIGAIQEELLLRPDLPVSCDRKAIGHAVHLVVQHVSGRSGRMHTTDLGKGFASIAGLGKSAWKDERLLEVGGLGTLMAGLLESNPTEVSLEVASSYWIDKMPRKPMNRAKRFWRWLFGIQTKAFLTLGDPERKGHVGDAVRFQCVEASAEGSASTAFATWVDGDARTVVTAKHLAFLISALA